MNLDQREYSIAYLITMECCVTSLFDFSDINECASDPCNNGGICNDEINGFTCTCQPGWSGTTCDLGKTY